MKNYFRIAIYISVIFLLFSLSSCALLWPGKAATVSPDDSVTKSFQELQINSAFNYFATGSDAFPRTILGLNKSYTLNSDLWKKIEPTHAKFYLLVNNMRSRGMILGYSITDGTDKQIGVWYSITASGLFVQITDNYEVIVSPPPDRVYRGYDGQMDK
jgi:hypothetical protein